MIINDNMNPKVDAFISQAPKWKEEFTKLRAIVLNSQLTEELKWGVPCYTHQGKNVVLIHGFKEYCALLFVKGSLLKDPDGILLQQTENVQAGRQVRFTHLQEICDKELILKEYLEEAINIEKSGQEVHFKKNTEFDYPEEFLNKCKEMLDLKPAFEALTPGRQRAYLLYFSEPKQAKTRESRIEKSIGPIMNGKGLNDQ